MLQSTRYAGWLGFIVLCAVELVGCGEQNMSVEKPAMESFLERHWADPLPPQGAPPASFSPLEASLSPESCGQCHAEQYQTWQTSLHSKAMGAGLLWQLKLMDQTQGNRCLRCHSPLAEQKALLAMELGWPNAPKQAPPDYVSADLGHRGLVCAACHLREHRRFGPPPRGRVVGRGGTSSGKQANSSTVETSADGTDRSTTSLYAPHGGFTIAPMFQDSQFCAHCHQFPQDGPRIAGKLQEDTYAQWLASPYSRPGPGRRTCQDCHMPDRKHLWRGIHDQEMTRRALDVSLQLKPLSDNRFEAVATVRNSGAGHHFPTYMVPKAEVRFLLLDGGGRERLLASHVIGWQVDTGITREIADTRLAGGESRVYRQILIPPIGRKWRLALIIQIAPGEHYERIYSESLGRLAQFPADVGPLLHRALADAQAARYQLMRIEVRPPSGSIAN